MNDECPTCLELVKESPLRCNHRVHLDCLKRQFKAECPLCRCKLNIQLYSKPIKEEIENDIESDIEYENEDEKEDEINNFINEDLENVYAEFSDDEEWKREGYLYKEESPDYDEENPDGDCVDY